jgi:DNA processing protein
MARSFDLLTLALVPALVPRVVSTLLARGHLADALAHPDEHGDLLPEAARQSLRTGVARRRAEEEARRARALGVRIVGRGEPDYPAWLDQTFDPPPVLFVRGRLVAGEGEQAVSVVGARKATEVGRAFARELAAGLVAAGLAVVSGLARGIDAAAHEGALDAGGRTVAVLGSGLDRLYPPEHAALAGQIANTGAVVSEFPFGTGPWKANFPRRNRVIAGWGRGVVVVEAGARSGALVTAHVALDEGREVMAVPGHPSFPGAEGTNRLLRSGNAALVRGVADVLSELGIETPRRAGLDAPEDELLAVLPRGVPMGVDEIQARCGRALPELLARLSALELASAVRRLPGALFVRS